MRVTRLGDAQSYSAPGHRGYASLAYSATDTDAPGAFAVGLSHFLPGGGAGPDSAPFERTYVVVAGHLRITCGDEIVTLGPLDSVYIAPGEVREIQNDTNAVTTIVVVRQIPA